VEASQAAAVAPEAAGDCRKLRPNNSQCNRTFRYFHIRKVGYTMPDWAAL
jgi:hypothetical protein